MSTEPVHLQRPAARRRPRPRPAPVPKPILVAMPIPKVWAWCLALLLASASSPAQPLDDLPARLHAASCRSVLPAASDTRPLGFEPALRTLVCRSLAAQRGAGQQQVAEAEWQQALARQRPELNASARSQRSTGAPAQQRMGLSGRWLLSDFGASQAAVKAADQGRQASRDERLAQLLQAMDSASTLYAQAMLAAGRHEAAAATLRSATASERMASARAAGGASSPAEALQAQRALGQARLDFTRSLTAREQAFLALKSALGLPADQPLWLDTDTALAEAQAWAEARGPAQVEAVVDQHPQLQAARNRRAEAQARADSVRAERWGQVQVQADAGRLRAGAGVGTASDNSLAVGWNLPLLDGGLLRARGQAAQGQAELSAREADEAARQVALAARLALAALDGERQALQAAQRLTESADAALTVTTERFRRGVGLYQEVLAAQDAAAAARNQRAEARAGLLRARWQLAVTLGDLSALG